MTTTTRTPERGLRAPARTEITVRADPDGGRVRVVLRHGGADGPSVRPVLTSSTPRRAEISLVPDGALLLAGDEIEIAVDVAPGLDLVLTEPGGTVAYPMDGGQARWSVEVTLGERAGLAWHGQPFVATRGSTTHRSLVLTCAASARVLLRETLVLGRHQEAGGILDSRTSVVADGRAVLREDLELDGAEHDPGVLGAGRVLDQVLALGLAGQLPEGPGRLDLAAGGVLYRAVAADAHDTGFDTLWRRLAQSATEE